MINLFKKFYNQEGKKYKVVRDISNIHFYKGDIIELTDQHLDAIDEMKEMEEHSIDISECVVYFFHNYSLGRGHWMYLKDLIHLEEYNDNLIELESKLNNEMTKKEEVLNKIDCLTRKLHESKEFKELTLVSKELDESIKNLKIEIQKAKISKIKIGQYYKMYHRYIYYFYVDEERCYYIQESDSNTNIVFNNKYIEYFKNIEELSIDDKDDDDFKDFQNNVQKMLKTIKGE